MPPRPHQACTRASSDQIFLDILAGVLLGLEPARHATAARPSFLRLGIAVFRLHLRGPALRRRIPIAGCDGAFARPTAPFCNSISQCGELSLQLRAPGRERLVMLFLHPLQSALLLLIGELCKPCDDGTQSKLFWHLGNLSRLSSSYAILLRKQLNISQCEKPS